MSNLAYIEELGIGEDQAVSDTEATVDETIEESIKDLNSDSEVSTSENDASEPSASKEDLYNSLKKQIEGMEKRIADKDAYIQELREKSKQPDETEEEQTVDTDEDEDFWDNPEEVIKRIKQELNEQKQTAKIQQLQIQEAHYAGTVEGYWDIVNQNDLQEAVARDTEFADGFNKSKEPYRFAYEYLKTKTKADNDSFEAEVERRYQLRLKEAGVKEKKEVPPNINGGGKSSTSSNQSSEDGFASVFGSAY